MRRFVAVLALAAACGVFADAQSPRAHVILVTIDGLRGDYLAPHDPYHVKIPALRRLIAEGTASDRTISVFPTLTGTAHTTLVTGVGAGRHGILGNHEFDPSVWAWGKDAYVASRLRGH